MCFSRPAANETKRGVINHEFVSTVSGLAGKAKASAYHSFTVKNPSYYTLYGCANTGSSPPKETKTSDNCGTRTFEAYGIPDVRVQSVVIQGGGTSFSLGSTITVVTDLANDGDNFIAGKNRKMTVSAELSGCVSTRTADVIEYHLGNDVFRYPIPNTYARQGARMP